MSQHEHNSHAFTHCNNISKQEAKRKVVLAPLFSPHGMALSKGQRAVQVEEISSLLRSNERKVPALL